MNGKEYKNKIGLHLRDIIFAANDGLVTTFAVIAGVVGADLSNSIILIVGFSNLFADGFSMAVGNYLGSKTEQEYLANFRLNKKIEKPSNSPLSNAAFTFVSFLVAGAFPILPFLFKLNHSFVVTVIVFSLTLFIIGSMRAIFSKRKWYLAGLEMLLVGGFAGVIAYSIGNLLKFLV